MLGCFVCQPGCLGSNDADSEELVNAPEPRSRALNPFFLHSWALRVILASVTETP